MYKLQLAIIALLFSFTAGSAGPTKTERWERVKDIVFESPAKVSPAGYAIKMRLYYDKEMRIELIVNNAISGGDGICAILGVPNLPNIWDINGRVVTYEADCDDNTVRLWPKFKNETKYVIDEFLTKQVVHIGPTAVSTEGFVKGYAEVLSYASYLD